MKTNRVLRQNMKATVLALALLVSGLASAAPLEVATIQVYFDVDGAVIPAGGVTVRRVNSYLPNALGAFSMVLNYDPSVVTISNVSAPLGSPYEGNIFADISSFASGTTRVTGFRTTAGLIPGDTNSLFQVTWKPVGSAYAITSVGLTSEALIDSQWLPTALFLTYNSLILYVSDLLPLGGTYAGLVNSSYPASIGSLAVTITTGRQFTASLKLGGLTYSFRGEFSATGNYSANIGGNGLPKVQISLTYGLGSGKEGISGLIRSGSVYATVIGEHSTFSASNPVPDQRVGTFTMFLPANPHTPKARTPQGTGYGSVAVTKSGAVRVTGVLSDGTTFSQGGNLSNGGTVPLFATATPAGGTVTGTLAFAADDSLEGSLNWTRAPARFRRPGSLFPDGIDTQLPLLGHRYTPPPYGQGILLFENVAGNSVATFSEGNITTPLAKLLTVSRYNLASVLLPGADKLALRLTPLNGMMTGTFVHPATHQLTTFHGALSQEENIGAGFFISSGRSGVATLEPNPTFGTPAVTGGINGDTTLPLLRITSPAPGARIASPNAVVVGGDASDSAGIAAIYYQTLHQGVLSAVRTATGQEAWTIPLGLTPSDAGGYTVYVKAVDVNGNESNLKSVQFDYVVPKP